MPDNRILLVPLDERPVNTRYPEMLAAIAGATVELPPASDLGLQRTPANLPAVAAWLDDRAAGSAAAIVSCDFLGYGNLINARISDDSAAEVIARLAQLERVNASCPVSAFSLITRVANADDCVEEPLYWLEWGTRIYRYARLRHRAERERLSGDEAAELDRLGAEIPADLRGDWMRRRLRNHAVNLALMDMAGRGRIESLLLTSDDTAAHGFPTRERDWLRGWPELVGESLASRLAMHPGADEVGSALVAKLIVGQRYLRPRVFVDWSIEADAELVAPYEDRPVRQTVHAQIDACGCRRVESAAECDFVLAVAAPSPRRTDHRPEFLAGDHAERTAPYQEWLNRLADHQDAGRAVALADVAYPNGADPLLAELMLAHGRLDLSRLAAYGAWNTAGNTLGVVVAQAACLLAGGDTARDRVPAAQALFLAHRFLEDYGYQTVVRREARAACEQAYGRRDPDPDSPEQLRFVAAAIAAGLARELSVLQARGVGQGLRLRPESVRLPWRRTFEVDFTLEPA